MSQLSTLSIKDLIFNGVHGSTGRERLDPQSFKVNVDLRIEADTASVSDRIEDTYDYKNAVRIARSVIENERYVLIEKISARIAEMIIVDPKIRSVEVNIQKLNASSNGIPGITMIRERSPQEIDEGLLDFDLREIIEKLDKEGGVSFPILTDEYRSVLLKEAETYEYFKQPEIVGPARVREQLSSVRSFRPESLFFRLKEDFEKTLAYKLKGISPNPFSYPLSFNEMSLQLYEKGSIGITPHMDGLSSVNMICIFVITGKARLALCDNREGANPRDLATTPGNVILLRSPGFMNSDFRPFHFVSDVEERRIIFGLRHQLPRKSK